MNKAIRLREELENIRDLLNSAAAEIDAENCNYSLLLEISIKMDQIVLEYLKNDPSISIEDISVV